MAHQGKKLNDELKRTLERLRAVLSVRQAAIAAGVAKSTVQKYAKKTS